ncbi:MAG: cell division protein ZipA C-terminal FtsZ-binding domain-containing protein [Steroidobacter sp.]
MTLTTQLRLIILAAGAVLLLIIYLLGRRGERETTREEVPQHKPKSFDEVPPAIDEDEYDEPSYLRRSGRRERTDTIAIHHADDENIPLPPVYIEPPVVQDTAPASVKEVTPPRAALRVPVLSMHDPDKTIPMKVDVVLPSASNVEAVNQSVTAPPEKAAAPVSTQASTPAQRQLIALRLAMSERVSGAQLLEMFRAENLRHGKFNIFHRLHDGDTVFSVASMVEPGSFDIETMPSQHYPGITLFMLLPGPLPGAEAFEQMMSCAQRLSHLTSGVVQDESGVMLLESGIQRLRDKVLDFERSLQA